MDNRQQDTFRVNLNINSFDNRNRNINTTTNTNTNRSANTGTNTSANNNFIEATNFIDNLYESIGNNPTTQMLALTAVSHLLIQTIPK